MQLMLTRCRFQRRRSTAGARDSTTQRSDL